MPILVLLRHAQAESFAPSDHDRRLTEQGERDAAATGEWLRGEGFAPGLALVSTAERTRQTWDRLRAAAGWSITPTYDESLYNAGEDGVLETLSALGAEESVLVIGHNPTMSLLAQLLDDGEGPASTDLATGGFPPATAVVLETHGPWAEIAPVSARVVGFHRGGSA